jgi:spore germination cell wall hydrolase CwlJ-like protein
MQSKPILFSIAFSALIFIAAAVNIDIYKMPYKTSYHSLNEETQRQVTCLAENIYFEAGHEPLEGKKAVAFVTINRVLTGNYAPTICDVVYQKRGNTCQFSWYCDSKILNKRLTIKETSLYNDIRDLAVHLVLNFELLDDVTSGSTYYHADYVNPNWKKLNKVDQIGRHIFYRSKIDEINKNRSFI